jgi:glycerol-3-phosphate dehydrogenase (NAD(P)+)
MNTPSAKSHKKIAVLGAGSCGTALAIALARSHASHDISLWVHGSDVLNVLRSARENSLYLPGIPVPERIAPTGELRQALAGADIVLGAMPSQYARTVYSAALPFVDPRMIFVSATKGLEHDSLLRVSEVMKDVMQAAFAPRIAVLSGPSFAFEVARGDPTAVVIASQDANLAAGVQHEFSGPTLRFYANDDTIGVEIGGAVKNVIAIAAGICAGLGLGSNSIAALVTRGLAEMTRLAVALGGRRDTLAGLAGLGDLVLTATGSLSRNRAVGVELGRGRPLADILAGMRMVAEGVGTTAVTLALARKNGVEMPIVEQMDAVLFRGRAPLDAMRELMERRLKQE